MTDQREFPRKKSSRTSLVNNRTNRILSVNNSVMLSKTAQEDMSPSTEREFNSVKKKKNKRKDLDSKFDLEKGKTVDEKESDSKVPALWIRTTNGQMHMLDVAVAREEALAPKSFKSKKKLEKKKTVTEKFKKIKIQDNNETFPGHVHRKSFFKPMSYDNTIIVNNVLAEVELLQSRLGVRISMESNVEPEIPIFREKIVEEEIIIPTEVKDTVSERRVITPIRIVTTPLKLEPLPAYNAKPTKKENFGHLPIRRTVHNRKFKRNGMADAFMYHIPQQSIMNQPFSLPPMGSILYGAFEKDMLVVEKRVRNPVNYRGQEDYLFFDTEEFQSNFSKLTLILSKK